MFQSNPKHFPFVIQFAFVINMQISPITINANLASSFNWYENKRYRANLNIPSFLISVNSLIKNATRMQLWRDFILPYTHILALNACKLPYNLQGCGQHKSASQ